MANQTVSDLKAIVNHELGWLSNARGRFQRLLDMKAPEVIIVNERTCWDDKVECVLSILKEGTIVLNPEGKTLWESILEEYLRLPLLSDILPRIRVEYEKGRRELLEKLRADGLSEEDLAELERIPG